MTVMASRLICLLPLYILYRLVFFQNFISVELHRMYSCFFCSACFHLCISSWFLFIDKWYSFVWMYSNLLMHSAAARLLDCFPLGIIINKVAMNVHLKVFVQTCFHFSWENTWEENYQVLW